MVYGAFLNFAAALLDWIAVQPDLDKGAECDGLAILSHSAPCFFANVEARLPSWETVIGKLWPP
jgi:hypothetical protein